MEVKVKIVLHSDCRNVKQTVTQLRATLSSIEDAEEIKCKFENIDTDYAHNKKLLSEKKTTIHKEQKDIVDKYFIIEENFNKQEMDALLNVQLEHIKAKESQIFDESHTTTMVNLYDLLRSTPIIDRDFSWDQKFTTNENHLECTNCIYAENIINNHFKAKASNTAYNTVAMILLHMNMIKAEDNFKYKIGIQTCSKDGSNLHCQTLQEAYKSALDVKKSETSTIINSEL